LKSNAEEGVIRQYLLGLLPPDRLPQLEERLLSDSVLYEELLMAEDKLIDQYLTNELSEAERKSFETRFLLRPERQQKIRFALTLKKYVATVERSKLAAAKTSEDPRPTPVKFFSFLRNPILAFSLVAAVLLLVFGSSWVFVRSRRPLEQPQLESRNVVAVVLTPGLIREGGEIKRISIPPGTETVQLRLQLSAVNYQSYRVVLLRSEGAEVWSRENLKPDKAGEKFLRVDLPAKTLRRDDYQIKVSGWLGDGNYEDMSRYPFRVMTTPISISCSKVRVRSSPRSPRGRRNLMGATSIKILRIRPFLPDCPPGRPGQRNAGGYQAYPAAGKTNRT
jgi:hypothetical protein